MSAWRLGGRNLLQVAWHRRSLVLLTIVVALILSGVYYAQAKSIYQSIAQVMVFQKSPERTINIDARQSNYEDYVATHQTIIKSPLIVEKAINPPAPQPEPENEMGDEQKPKLR